MLNRRSLAIAAVSTVLAGAALSRVPVAAGHPHGEEERTAIKTSLDRADRAIAQAGSTLLSLRGSGSADAPSAAVRRSMESVSAEFRNLRTAVETSATHPLVDEDLAALQSFDRIAREFERMSVALANMTKQFGRAVKQKI